MENNEIIGESRVLKFRAREEGVGMLRSPQSVLTALSRHLRATHSNAGEWYSKNPEYIPKYIIMQYTGMKDYNGTEIYEGDILEHKGKFYLVEFKYGEFMTSRKRFDNVGDRVKDLNNLRNFLHNNKTIVAGNIYENPEMSK